MGLAVLCRILLYIHHVRIEYPRIFYVPHNIVMDLNNVMKGAQQNVRIFANISHRIRGFEKNS
jgi:hypothetical protein